MLFFKRDRERFGFLSNYHEAPVTIDGETWRSAEFYYQAQKSDNPAYREAIRQATSADHAKGLGSDPQRSRKARKRSWFHGQAEGIRGDWDEVKLKVMATALRAKFGQNPDLQALLLATGDAAIVEDSAHDPFWGIGRDGQGLNWLGRLLMEVRQELRAAQPTEAGPRIARGNRLNLRSAVDCTTISDPHRLLDEVNQLGGSARKYRLFAVACCRRLAQYLSDPASRAVVDVFDRRCDGHATQEELVAALAAARVPAEEGDLAATAPALLSRFLDGAPDQAARAVADAAVTAVHFYEGQDDAAAQREAASQCDLLREIFGSQPTRTPVLATTPRASDRSLQLAESIYREGRFSDLPALADMLEADGYPRPDVVQHLRDAASHLRGCWALDFVLGIG
ncbi:MAG: NADAR family protein [Planctomycetia bacterium]|nr:NADAR family protein [Planctomycetia bacterium]